MATGEVANSYVRRIGTDSLRKDRKRRRLNTENRAGYLFILPSIIGLLVYVIYPLIMSAYYSLTQWNGVTSPRWVGLENFRHMFTQDPLFWNSLRTTIYFVVLTVPSTLVVGLLLAVLLNRPAKGIRIFRTIFFLPVVLPSIAVLTMWKYLYDPQFGLANEALKWLHLPTSLWLGGTRMAMPSIVLIGLWGVGGTMIIFLAGLQNVPNDVYEAAKIDGAGSIRTFFRVTLPMITPILLLQLILQINGAFQAFNQISVLTQGGPDNHTDLLMYKIYQDGFTSSTPLMGYATAEVWVLFILVLIVTAFTFRTSSMWIYDASSGE